MITIEQIKAARAMLDMSQKKLAEKAGIAVATLNNIERRAQTDPKISTVNAIRQALEKEGIEFTQDNLGSIGLQLKPHSANRKHARILLVDDNNADRALYKNWLQKAPNKHYQIIEATNAREGFDAFLSSHPDCVLLDFMMYGADGFQLLAALKRDREKIPPIIFITGMHNEILEESAHAQGVYAYFNKNILAKEDLYQAIDSAINFQKPRHIQLKSNFIQ